MVELVNRKKKKDKGYTFRIDEEEFQMIEEIRKNPSVSLPRTLRRCIRDTYKKITFDDDIDSRVY